VAMSKPQLSAESVWIARWRKAQRQARRSRRPAGGWNDGQWLRAERIDVGNLLNTKGEVGRRDILLTLIVQSPSVPGPESPPPSRVNLDTRRELDRIILKCVRRAAANVLR